MTPDITLTDLVCCEIGDELKSQIVALLEFEGLDATIAGPNAPSWAPAKREWVDVVPRRIVVQFDDCEVLPVLIQGESARDGYHARWVAVPDFAETQQVGLLSFRVVYDVRGNG